MNFKKTFLIIFFILAFFAFRPFQAQAMSYDEINEEWTTCPNLANMGNVKIPKEYTEPRTLASETNCNNSVVSPLSYQCVLLWRPILQPVFQVSGGELVLKAYKLYLLPNWGISICNKVATGTSICPASDKVVTESLFTTATNTGDFASFGRRLFLLDGTDGGFRSVRTSLIVATYQITGENEGIWVSGNVNYSSSVEGILEFGLYENGQKISNHLDSANRLKISYSKAPLSISSDSWGLNDPQGNLELDSSFFLDVSCSGGSSGGDDDGEYPLPPILEEDLIDEIEGDWGTLDSVRVGLNVIIRGLNNVWRFISSFFRSLFNWLLGALEYLFKPDDELIQEKETELKTLFEQKVELGGWRNTLDSVKNAFSTDVTAKPSNITATIFGQNVTLLDFDMIDKYIGTIRLFLGAFILLGVVVAIAPKITRELIKT